MPRRRGVARISSPRRRVYRIKAKWDPKIAARRSKRGLPFWAPELDFEIDILLELERRVFAVLQQQVVPSERWQWYMAFAKRIWERALQFSLSTFILEKTSLVNEFTLRGLDPNVLTLIQVEAEAMAELKLGRLLPPAWTYDNVIGKIWMQEWGAYDTRMAGAYFLPPEGIHGGYYDNRE